ncbi:hypothetical protein [Owenweeksia hongkongensis]|uniref:hypothetical protein n=1 Tax=Owenweeksia hongkongensis TaxID=253245 RepID=UPI003A8F524E
MKLLRFIIPAVLMVSFGLFYYLSYETVQQLNDSYTGVGIAINKVMVLLYSLLGRHGTFLLISLIGIYSSFYVWKKSVQKDKRDS